MHGTAAVLRPELDRLTSAHPEWGVWLDLVGRALGSLDGSPWNSLQVELAPERVMGAPVLNGATLRVPVRSAGRWTRAFLRDAARGRWSGADELRRARVRRLDALALLAAAVTGRRSRLDEIAAAHGIPPDALAAVAHAAALPLMIRARERVADRLPADWQHGYCPFCGAWPALAELQGLDRKRSLRCGRCGGGWVYSWLRCPFCDEHRHQQLGSLVPEREDDTRRSEKCESCHGYVKTVATLQPVSPLAVPLEDLRTVELDLAAAERGYHRPDGDGWLIEIHIAPSGRLS